MDRGGGSVRKTKKRRKWRRTLLAALDLPLETEGQILKMVTVGNTDMLIENHQGILQYVHGKIRLHTEEGILCVEGEGLELLQLGLARAYIKGRLCGFHFESESNK